jgi:hypothetical protein
MKSRQKKIQRHKLLFLLFFVLFNLFSLSSASQAQDGGIVPCGHSGEDPCNICYFIIGIKNLTQFGMEILITLALLGFIVTGILSIVSLGSPKLLSTSKSFGAATLKYFTIVLIAWLLVSSILTALSAKEDLGVGQSNWYTFTCSTTSEESPGPIPPPPPPPPPPTEEETLTVTPGETMFDKPNQTQQLNAIYKDLSGERDVTNESIYSSEDTSIAEVSSSGLVTKKATFQEGEQGPKETKILVKYNSKSVTVNVVVFSPTCSLQVSVGHGDTEKYLANFSDNLFSQNIAYAESSTQVKINIPIEPNKIALQSIKNSEKLCIKACIIEPEITSIKSKIITLKKDSEEYSAESGVVNQTMLVCFPNKSKSGKEFSAGKYNLSIKIEFTDGKTAKGEFPGALEITGEDSGQCTSINPTGLKTYDNRLPLIFIADSDYAGNIEELKTRVSEYAKISIYPVDSTNYTVWVSEKPNENPCPFRAGNQIIYLHKNGESPVPDLPSYYDALGNIQIFDAPIRKIGINPTFVLTHEMGHAHGKLKDEYGITGNTEPSSVFPSAKNCFSSKEINGEELACQHFKQIAGSSYDCNNIEYVCNGVTGKDKYNYTWFSAQKSIMGLSAETFGPVCEKLYLDELQKLKPK